jgi:hypothetical protein
MALHIRTQFGELADAATVVVPDSRIASRIRAFENCGSPSGGSKQGHTKEAGVRRRVQNQAGHQLFLESRKAFAFNQWLAAF